MYPIKISDAGFSADFHDILDPPGESLLLLFIENVWSQTRYMLVPLETLDHARRKTQPCVTTQAHQRSSLVFFRLDYKLVGDKG